ncbi:hypothetical protein TeGR_g11777, partial [Tetraparma gracilis]
MDTSGASEATTDETIASAIGQAIGAAPPPPAGGSAPSYISARAVRKLLRFDDPFFRTYDADHAELFAPAPDLGDGREDLGEAAGRGLDAPPEAPAEPAHPCAVCGLSFPSLPELSAHAALHSFQCSACMRTLADGFQLERHIEERHDPFWDARRGREGEAFRGYLCLVQGCGGGFATDGKRKKHLIEEHSYPGWFNFHSRDYTKKQKQ